MKIINFIIYIGMIVLLLCQNLEVKAQSFEDWMKILKDQSEKSDQQYMKTDVRAIDLAENTELYRTTMEMRKGQDKFQYTTDGIEVRCDGKYLVTVNHQLQIISYQQFSKTQIQNNNQ
ncbi:MAG: hypothetical protein AAFQ94_16915, partial [Bacteroidota bacterium]